MKLRFFITLMVVVALLIADLGQLLADEVESVIHDDNEYGSTVGRLSFESHSQLWAVYQDNDDKWYIESSQDYGVNWGNKTEVYGINSDGCLKYDGAYAHLLFMDKATMNLKYVRLDALANGSVTIDAVDSTGYTAYQNAPNTFNIGVDTLGYPYIAYYYFDGSGKIYVRRSSTKDGTWTHDASAAWNLSGSQLKAQVGIAEGAGGDMLVFQCKGDDATASPLYAQKYDYGLDAWSGSWIATTNDILSTGLDWGNSFSVVSRYRGEGTVDDIDVAFVDEDNDINYCIFDMDVVDFGTEDVVYAGTDIRTLSLSWIHDEEDLIIWWKNDSVSDVMYYSLFTDSAWQAPVTFFTDLTGLPVNGGIDCAEITTEELCGVFHTNTDKDLEFRIVWGSGISPLGTILPATGVTSSNAVLNGFVVWDGGANCTAKFFMVSIDGYQNETFDVSGNFTTSDYVSYNVYNDGNVTLAPSTRYFYIMELDNGVATHATTLGTFITLAASGYGSPIVDTSENVITDGDTYFEPVGYLVYDGEAACACGFLYREQGDSTWINSGGIRYPSGGVREFRSPHTFSQELTELSPNTTYEYRAFAQNLTGTVYGEIETYTTLGIVGEDTDDDTGLGGIWNLDIGEAFSEYGFSTNQGKVLLALIIIGGVFLFFMGAGLPLVGAYTMMAFAFIGMIYIGWIPVWLIVMGAVIVAVLGFRKFAKA